MRGKMLEPDTYLGELRIISFAGIRNKTHYYECECACGEHFTASKQHILSGRTQRCPNCARGYDLRGQKSGDWIAIHRCGHAANGLALWRCTCEICGASTTATSTDFRNGTIPACSHSKTYDQTIAPATMSFGIVSTKDD